VWLMKLISDPAVRQSLLNDVGQTVFKGRPIIMRVRGPDGKPQVGTLRGAAEQPKPRDFNPSRAAAIICTHLRTFTFGELK
jgi:hypothetical protein